MKTIGKGNFAKVKLAKHMPTGQEVREREVEKVRGGGRERDGGRERERERERERGRK